MNTQKMQFLVDNIRKDFQHELLAEKEKELTAARTRIAELEAALEEAITDSTLGIPTRKGWSQSHRSGNFTGDIVFYDIDEMKRLNAEHGHEGVNALLRKGLELARADDTVFRWFNGDEFVAMLGLGDAPGFLARLTEAYRKLGMSFTACYASCVDTPPRGVIERLDKEMLKGKENGRRGEAWEMTK